MSAAQSDVNKAVLDAVNECLDLASDLDDELTQMGCGDMEVAAALMTLGTNFLGTLLGGTIGANRAALGLAMWAEGVIAAARMTEEDATAEGVSVQ